MSDMGILGGNAGFMSGYDFTPSFSQSLSNFNQVNNNASNILGSGTANLSGGIGSFGNTLGFNLPTAQLGLAGLSTIGNLWGAFGASKLAKSQFDYTKQITNTNLANQIKSYNTALTDRANSRAVMQGWNNEQTQQYINDNKL